jgi:hypothetical protein
MTINEHLMAWGREEKSHPSATLPIFYHLLEVPLVGAEGGEERKDLVLVD